MHENRETSGVPRPVQDRGRSEKAQSRTSGVHAPEESDRTIVPMNQSNKEDLSSAEAREGRVRAKENIGQFSTSPTQSGKTRVSRIERCAASSQVGSAATIQGKSRMR